MKKSRNHYSPAEKVAVLRRHLLEKEPISKPCDELGLQPTVFYRMMACFSYSSGQKLREPNRCARSLCRSVRASRRTCWR